MDFPALKSLLFARSNFGMKLGLARMRAALALLGAPHRCAPALHVAGSNGKGSTCAFAEASLRAAGLKTGLYTSPHLVHFCERIRVAGAPISEPEAASLLEEILARVPWALRGGPQGDGDGDGLTFFELVTLMGFLAFARARVDAMVIEVGLGGRLDATNVVEPLACAIAALSLEHTQHLGDTLEAIAGEKGGIIKPGVPVVTAGHPARAARVLQAIADERGSPLFRPGRDYRYDSRDIVRFCYQSNRVDGWTIRAPAAETAAPEPAARSLKPDAAGTRHALDPRSGLALHGHHQRANAALACALLEQAARRGLPVRPEHVEQGLREARWPGRLQLISEEPETWLDGAHNPQGAEALARAMRERLGERAMRERSGDRSLQLVFGALADKDVSRTLAPLLPLAREVHVCAPATPRALPTEQLAARVAELAPALSCKQHGSAALALQAARDAAGPDGAVLACGSLYLAGELLASLSGQPAEAMPAERLHAAQPGSSGGK